MIQKLQNIFHTDKWWGKVSLILFIYSLIWFLFYFILFFASWYLGNFFGGWFILFYLFAVILLSIVYVPKTIIKIFYINKVFLYILHIFFIILSLFLTGLFILFKMQLNFGGF